MKSIKLMSTKLAITAIAVVLLAGCSGTTYNHDKTCSTDFLLVPAISVSGALGACDEEAK